MNKQELTKKVNELENYIQRELDSVPCKVSKFPKKGRGIVAKTNIRAGDVFLTCPAIKLSPGDMHFIEKTVIQYYVFGADEDLSPFSYFSLGMGALFNHNKRNNAEFKVDEDSCEVTFKSLVDIKKGEEIEIDYGW